MEKAALISQLSDFLKTDPATQSCLRELSAKAEISIRIGGADSLWVRVRDRKVETSEQMQSSPDFVFDASPEALLVLVSEQGLSP
ncbi:MAG: SCP2 sterol-binding domain-containing protein, partial [Pseudomonadota bacterium]